MLFHCIQRFLCKGQTGAGDCKSHPAWRVGASCVSTNQKPPHEGQSFLDVLHSEYSANLQEIRLCF